MGIRPFLVAAVLLAVTAVDGSAHRLKGDGPNSMAAAFGSVWVGMGNGDVVRIDAWSGREQARLPGGATESVHGIVAAYGAVWALRGRLVRIDPRARVAREVPNIGSATAFVVRAGARAIWVADDGSNEIVRIDPKTLRLVARIRVPGRAWGVAAGPRTVVVLAVPHPGPVTGPDSPRVLRRIDPKTNRLSVPLAHLECDVGMAVGSGAVWTFDECAGLLARRDPTTLRVVRQRKLRVPGQTPALGFGSVWLAGRSGAIRVDPTILRTQAVIPARSLSISIGDQAVWAFDPVHSTIRRINPATNRVVGMRITVAPNP